MKTTRKMFKSLAFFSVVLLYQCGINNLVESNPNLSSNYELLDSEQYFNDIDITAKTVALLVEDNPRNMKNVLRFVETVFSDNQYKNSDFWLVTFNSSGVSSVWEKSYDNIDQFHGKLGSLVLQIDQGSEETSNTSLVLFALLNTAQTLPENAAIVLFSDSFVILDNHLEKITLNKILSKNISVYTVNDSELKVNDVVKNIVDFSGGKTFNIRKGQKSERYSQDSYHMPEQNISVILTRKNIVQVNNLSFPIDHDVTGLHIVISPSKTTGGILISPSGYRFAFSKNAKANSIRYSPGSFFGNEDGLEELHLNFSTSGRSNVGIWQLKLENLVDFYNVTVFAFTSISAEATIHLSEKGHHEYEIPKDVMKLGVTGKISHITDISVLDSNGETVLSNISYKFNNNRLKYVTENIDNVPDTGNKEVDVEINRLHHTQPAYALIRGKDVKGNIFQRLGYIFGSAGSDIYPQQFLTVEVGLGSELITTSGKRAEVYFEVTNHASSAQQVAFSCSDQKYILQSLSNYRRYLEPEKSTIVTLSLNTKSGTYQDEITFSANSGSLVVQKKVFVDVGSQTADQNRPELYHKFTSDCSAVIFSSCTKGTWTIEITARDTESGILQLNTVPKGLYFPHGYTAGTKDSVTGYFSESCCNPKLQISAVDRMNNVKSYDVNAYYSTWSPGAIAALVLGILLFIILVAVIIFCAVKRWKKKETYDLPTYRGGGI